MYRNMWFLLYEYWRGEYTSLYKVRGVVFVIVGVVCVIVGVVVFGPTTQSKVLVMKI